MNTVNEQFVTRSAIATSAPLIAASAVSWGAIVAGAAGAAALSLIMLILGVGLGLSSVSPWAYDGISATTFGVSTILWVTLTQLLASGMGGYIAGRLRTKWQDVHTDEVYFRDTAHGFLAWAIASLATAALLTSAIGSIIGGGIKTGAAMAGGAATALSATTSTVATASSDPIKSGSESGALSYLVDSLFRSKTLTTSSTATHSGNNTTLPTTLATLDRPDVSTRLEVIRIFSNAGESGSLPPEDVRYVGQLVAQRTGLTQQEAEQQVTTTYARLQEYAHAVKAAAKDAADKARKASAYASLWLFISLLIGAFVASLAATHGGRQRDL